MYHFIAKPRFFFFFYYLHGVLERWKMTVYGLQHRLNQVLLAVKHDGNTIHHVHMYSFSVDTSNSLQATQYTYVCMFAYAENRNDTLCMTLSHFLVIMDFTVYGSWIVISFKFHLHCIECCLLLVVYALESDVH